MNNIIKLQRKITPELIAMVEERYNILKHIQFAQPIGRRALASLVGMGERSVRSQVDFLKEAGLIVFSAVGMQITPEGFDVLSELVEYVRAIRGLTELEIELQEILAIEQVVIVPGDSDRDAAANQELGRAGAKALTDELQEDMIVAVSGGSTMARVAEAISLACESVLVVPARGGLGDEAEFQANNIAAVMAKKLRARYRQLYIPDGVSEETLSVILREDAQVKSVIDSLQRADILVYGIGTVQLMAERRGLSVTIQNELVRCKAAGEVLGQYCSLSGEIIHVTGNVGLLLDDLSGIGKVIAVAGGQRKAEAILAVAAVARQDVLVTDEGAARAIHQLKNNN